MDRTERIARLLSIPLLLTVGMLLFVEYRDRSAPPDVTAEAAVDAPTATASSEAVSRTEATEATEADETSGPDTTVPQSDTEPPTTAGTAAEGIDLPEADPAAPPQEPIGTYSDGRVVLRGSVPRPELAAAFEERAASVLGSENVTSEMTLDERVSGGTMTVTVEEQFRFPSGTVEFDPKFEALLNLGAAALHLLPESTLVVTGHTDDVGSVEANLALSQARAQIVVDWMVGRGIAPGRVIARGAGEAEPIADNATPEGREANRRIEAVLEGVTPTDG